MEQQGQGPMMTSQGQVITSIGMGGGGTVTMAPNGIYFMILLLILVKVAISQQIFSICFHFTKYSLKVGEKYFLKFNHI